MSEDQLLKLIKRDTPELNGILDELIESLQTLNQKLRPVLDKINNSLEASGQ